MKLDNLYGRIIFREQKGCSYYFQILNANSNQDRWIRPIIKLETELSEFDSEIKYNREGLINKVMENIKMPFLKRLKQFMLRFLRNNLL